MLDMLQSLTLLLLGLGVIGNALATRHLLKALNNTNELLRMVMIYTVWKP